jgi:fucose permease
MILFFSESVQVLWVGTALLGLSMASIFPTLILFAEERMHLTSQITSWFLIGTGFGAMFLPWLIGQFFASFGPQTTIIIIFIDLVAAFLIFLGLKKLFPLKKSRKTAKCQQFLRLNPFS